MEGQHENPLRCLKERFDKCYDDFKAETIKMGAAKVFDFASDIIAVKDVHLEMCFWLEISMCNIKWPNHWYTEPVSEREAAYLLSLENPLTELADKWWFHTLGNRVDFQAFYSGEIKK